MIERSYTGAIDRDGWDAGPWDDRARQGPVARRRATDLDCLAVRNQHGSWCGYVGVAPGHPWHGRSLPGS